MRGLNLPRREPKFKHNSFESEGNFIIVLIINSLINPRKGNIIFFTVYMQAQTQFQNAPTKIYREGTKSLARFTYRWAKIYQRYITMCTTVNDCLFKRHVLRSLHN